MKIHYCSDQFSAASPSGLLVVPFRYAVVALQDFRSKIDRFATCFSLR